MIKKLKINLIIFIIIFLSPVYVNYYWSDFTVNGWMGIGQYDNNLSHGFYMSFIYAIYFIPLFYFLIKFSRPILTKNITTIKNKSAYVIIINFFILFYIVAYSFKLGITGVETPTEWHLSGLVHYFRSYLAPIVIIGYLSTQKPSLNYIFIYSLIAGIASASRFVGVTPLALYFIFSYINKTVQGKKFLSILMILLVFMLITAARQYIFSDNPNIEDVILSFEQINSVVNQIFLRVGIGRDVMLSFEVLDSGACNEYIRFFLTGHSCSDPPLDFYGLYLESHQYYLAAPTLPNFFIISDGLGQILLYILFILQIYIGSKLVFLISKFGNVFVIYSVFSQFLNLVFIIIGPILFFNYIIILNTIILLILHMVKINAKKEVLKV
jgi:hypothetical protein